MQLFKKNCFILLFIWIIFSPIKGFSYESDFQGFLSPSHNHSHQARINDTFYNLDEGKFRFSPDKVKTLLEKIRKKHEDLKESFYLSSKLSFIEKHNYSNKKAAKKALKRTTSDARVNFPFIYLETELENLLLNYRAMTDVELRDKVARLSVVNETINYRYQDNIYRGNLKTIHNLIKPYHSIPRSETLSQQASNLIYNGKFITQEKFKELELIGADFSTFNPPNSSFWRNTDIESFDPLSELHRGEEVFPDHDAKLVYSRMGRGNIKIKAKVFPHKVKDVCATEEESISTTIRLGQETNNHLISTNLARAVGYPYIPHTPRKSALLYLCNTSFEEFLSEWDRVHQDRQGSFLTYGEYLSSIHAIRINDLALEAYTGKEDGRYRKGGQFRTESMGLRNRREIRGQLIFNAFIALIDAKEPNVRVDFYKPINEDWKPMIYASDMGRSLGFYFIRTHGTVNHFLKSFISKGDDVFRVWWDHQGYDPKLYNDVTLSDAKWMARRLARLSDKQLNDIVENTHLVTPVKELYKVKLKKRIVNLINTLGLSDEVELNYEIPTDKALSETFPQYISSDGLIKVNAENIKDTNSRPLGANTTIKEALSIGVMNAVFKAINGEIADLLSFEDVDSNSDIEIFGGKFDTGYGIRISSSRKISINPEKGEKEKRLLVKDSMVVSVPIGLIDEELKDSIFDITLPLGAYYTYSFDYYFSVNTIGEASLTDFFKRLIPWRAPELARSMKVGEGLTIKHSYGLSIGDLEVKINDNLGGSISPFSYKNIDVKKVYIYKPTKKLIELSISDSNQDLFKSGVELNTVVSFLWKWEHTKTSDHYEFYRFKGEKLLLKEKEFIQELVVGGGAVSSKNLGKTYVVDSTYRENSTSGCFFIWCSYNAKESSNFEVNLYTNPWSLKVPMKKLENLDENLNQTKIIKKYKVLVSESFRSSSRDFSGILVEDLDIGVFEAVANLGFDITKEGSSEKIKLEGVWDEKNKKLEKIDVEVLLAKNDNLLTLSEMNDWDKFYTKRVYCKANEGQSYLNLEVNENIDYYSPISSLLLFQVKEKGLEEILTRLKAEPRICKKLCQRILKKISNKNLNSLKKAQQYADRVVRVLKLSLGKNLKNLGCVRELIKNEKKYWLVTKADTPLLYNTPVAEGKIQYFAKEIGKYQGPSFFKNFKFKTHYKPIVIKEDLSPDL